MPTSRLGGRQGGMYGRPHRTLRPRVVTTRHPPANARPHSRLGTCRGGPVLGDVVPPRVPSFRLCEDGGHPVKHMLSNVALLLALSPMLVCCSAAAPSPSRTTIPGVVTPSASSSSTQPASTSPDAALSPLEGHWATGPIPIAEIKTAMVAAGIDPSEADAWIAEVGSPTRYSFELVFSGTAFTHSEETPDMAMQVGEAGTFTLSGNELVLTNASDTYTLQATLADDELSLRWVSSTEQGTAQDQATHRRFTIAFYCSAPFTRQP